jgi:hypothetical protein
MTRRRIMTMEEGEDLKTKKLIRKDPASRGYVFSRAKYVN